MVIAPRAPRAPRIVAWARMGDESLASKAAAGNDAAFTALYERYYGPLEGYCRSILLNAEDARDATQAALENALRSLPRREPGRPLKPWLYRIAHNEAINIVRRRPPVAELTAMTEPSVPGPEVDAEQRVRLAQLVDDLQMLPERQRGALVMRELSGLSYDDIGGALGVSNEAARRAVFDARSALHDAVDGRATACVSVRRSLSDGDRRSLRGRPIRAHLRACNDCASFQRTIGVRQADLHALGPWLPGATALGLIGLGGGAAGGGALVVAGGGTSVAVSGGGLGWAGLPAAVKGLAVAAVVATTGTAAVEIPKVTAPERPARQAQLASAATARAADPGLAAELRAKARAVAASAAAADRALSGAGADRFATLRRTSNGRGGGAGTSVALPRSPAPAAATAAPPPAAAMPVTSQRRTPATTPPPRSARPASVAATSTQVAIDALQRIRERIQAAFQQAQGLASTGSQSSIASANSIVQSTLSSVRPMIERILAPFGLQLPPAATATATATAPAPAPSPSPGTSPSPTPSPTTVLAPAQNMLSGINTLLGQLFGSKP